jgi:hypothetical protein
MDVPSSQYNDTGTSHEFTIVNRSVFIDDSHFLLWYTWTMNETYTLQLKQVGDHLEVFIPELNVTVSTEPGKTSRDDALDVAHQAIEEYHLSLREHVKAS